MQAPPPPPPPNPSHHHHQPEAEVNVDVSFFYYFFYLNIYKSLIRPLMEYGDVIWNNCYDCDSALLDNVQYEAARLVTGAIKGTSSARLYKELAWESLTFRRKLHILSHFYKIVKNLAPHYLSELLPKLSSERTHYRLRSRENLTQFSCRTSRFQKSFFPSAITGWNSLDLDVRNSVSLPTFKAKLRSTLFPQCWCWSACWENLHTFKTIFLFVRAYRPFSLYFTQGYR